MRATVECRCDPQGFPRREVVYSASATRLGGEFFWVGLGQAAAALGGIVGVRLLTDALPPAVYGELALGMTVATLVQQTVLGPPVVASLRFFTSALASNQLRAFLQGIRQLLAQATVIVLAVVCVLSIGLWVSEHAESLELAIAALLFALLSSYSAVLDGMQNAARRRVVVAWHDGLASWLRFLTAVALVNLIGAFSHIAMFGYALAALVVLGSQCWFLGHKISLLCSIHPWEEAGEVHNWSKRMYGYAWPFAMWGLFSWAQIASDRWALETFTTTGTVGQYAVLYQLGYYPISALSGMMMQFVAPLLFERAGDGCDPERLQNAAHLNYCLILSTVSWTGFGSFLAFLFHSQFFSLLVAPA